MIGVVSWKRCPWYHGFHEANQLREFRSHPQMCHRSHEFIGFLKKLDAAYPSDTAIKVILDNHSAHVSKETKKWLAAQADGRFTFVITPKHGSWLNLVEGFFSKMARSVLRRIRIASKAELKQQVIAYLDDLNREPVVHTWSYRITVPA